jgi:anti-sigma factor RsiW
MTSSPRTPDWLLERIALGELPPEALAEARARLAREPGGEARLAALEAENERLLARLPPATVAREVQLRLAREEAARRAPPSRPLLSALALVPVLAVLLLVLARPGEPSGPPSEAPTLTEVTRVKGLSPRLGVYRQGPAGAEALSEGALATAGDVVQLTYVAAGAPYGVILSLDGRGTLTLHVPEAGGEAARLEPSGTHALPRAYSLDDAPAFERFFFITSSHPFPLEEVLAAARELATSDDARTAPLPLSRDLGQTSFTLEKTSP